MTARPLAALVALLAACGAKTDLSEPEPEPEPTGPPPDRCYAVCACIDGSAALTTAPIQGKGGCFNACDDACRAREGVGVALGSPDGVGAIPYCEAICAKVDAAGCASPCEELIGPCEPSDASSCPAGIAAQMECLAKTASVVCDGDVVRLDGCDLDSVATCPAD
jgi:hypothetical protein